MASFNQQQNSFAEIQGYTPDFNFLTRGYAAKQAQYDRGFNAVKSFYNSILNKDVTNPENKKYREDAYKKIQTSIKNLSSVDLSNPANIQQANSILNPIAQDKDIIYDMYITGKNNEARQQMEMYKNSMDPEQRAKYNDYSALDIQFAEEDLANAQRGNGSIQQVRPGEFIPFDDVNKYLNDVAKEQKLEIKYDELSNGYIIKHVNGPKLAETFTSWAIQQMGNKFDRQFQLMGKVESETAIRGLMKTLGYDREKAINTLGEKQREVFIQYQGEQKKEIETALRQYKSHLDLFNNKYPNGVPANLQQQYEQVKEAVSSLEQAKLNKENDIKTIAGSDSSYIANNLSGYLSQTYKQETASRWGKTYATANEELSITPDAMAIAKYNNSIKVMLDREHQQLERQKMSMDYQFKTAELGLKQQENIAKGYGPSMTEIGTYVSPTKISSFDLINQGIKNVQRQAINTVFGADGGLINIVQTDPDKKAAIKTAVYNLSERISDPTKISENDKKALQEYATYIGADNYIQPTNEKQAKLVLEYLMMETYRQANENAPKIAQMNKSEELGKVANSSIKSLAKFKELSNQENVYYENLKKIANVVENTAGYDDAKVIDNIAGVNVYDLSSVDEGLLEPLKGLISPSLQKKENVISKVYNIKNLSDSELFSLTSSNIADVVENKGSSFNMESFSKLSPDEQKKLVNNAQVTFDASTRKATVVLKSNITSEVAGKYKMKNPEQIVLQIDYSSIEAHKDKLPNFYNGMAQNSVSPATLSMFDDFATNKWALYTSSPIVEQSGFKYRIHGDEDVDGNYGVSIKIEGRDPKSNTFQPITETFQPIQNPQNSDSYLFLEKFILQGMAGYQTGLVNYLNTTTDAE